MAFSTISGFASEESQFQKMNGMEKWAVLGKGFSTEPLEGGVKVFVSVVTHEERVAVRMALSRLGVKLEEGAQPQKLRLGGSPQYIFR